MSVSFSSVPEANDTPYVSSSNISSFVNFPSRTPLTLISGPINDALDEATSQREQERLKLVARNVNRLRKLVDVSFCSFLTN